MIQMDSGDRLRVTLLDRISTVESRRSLTLEAVLRADKRASPPAPTAFPPPPPTSPPPLPETPARTHANRTLLDVMRDEHRHSHDLDHGHGRDKTAWKSLREKLRLKRSAAVWTSSNPIPNSDTPLPNEDNVIPDNSDSNRLNQLGFLLSSNSEGQSSHSQTDQTNNADISSPSTVVEREGRLRLGAALAEERALSARETNTSAVTDTLSEVQPPRMSLMELLEENEGQIGVAGAGIYDTDEDGDGEENEERDEEGEGAVAAVVERGCCVCMVRNKGAAFIPCGHTFCRLCSRELWVQRGNCPLCNASILEILDIF